MSKSYFSLIEIRLDPIRMNNFEAYDQCDWFSFSLSLYTSVRASLKHSTSILTCFFYGAFFYYDLGIQRICQTYFLLQSAYPLFLFIPCCFYHYYINMKRIFTYFRKNFTIWYCTQNNSSLCCSAMDQW